MLRRNDHTRKTAPPRDIEQARDERASDSVAPMRAANRHSDDARGARVHRNQATRANKFAVNFRDDEIVAALNVMRVDVVEIGIARLVNPTEMLAQSVQNELTRGNLIARLKRANRNGHNHISDALDRLGEARPTPQRALVWDARL